MPGRPSCVKVPTSIAFPTKPLSRPSMGEMMSANNQNGYNDAIAQLNLLQSGFAVLTANRKSPGRKKYESAMQDMQGWLQRIGYTPGDLNRLNIIHVAGSKGKGSTCAFVNSILSSYRTSRGVPRKIGLYTSPHLVAVRERIRINSVPISEALFAKYFFEVWNVLGLEPGKKPVYFRFLTLLSFHVFMRENVDVAIYEVGVGGEWDSTNVIEAPAATGITTLGLDHVKSLGDTIEKIAWHKAGIFKPECPAFSVDQLPAAIGVLEERAREKSVKLQRIPTHPALRDIKISPNVDYQKTNASLAIALATTVLEKLNIMPQGHGNELPKEFVDALEQVVWRGRCETKVDGNVTWYVDGAHTDDSIQIAGRWFAGIAAEQRSFTKILLFNHQSQRNATALLEMLQKTVCIEHEIHFDRVLFCPDVVGGEATNKNDLVNMNSDKEAIKSLTVQKEFAKMWDGLGEHGEISVLHTIQEAVAFVRDCSSRERKVQVFVTGDLHLVGGVLSFLDSE